MTKTATGRPSGHGVLSRHHRLLPSYLEMVHRPAMWSRPGVVWSSVERSGVLRAGQCGLIWSSVEHCLVYCAPIPWCQFEPQHWWSSLGVLITDQLTTLPCLNNHTFSEQKLLKGSKRQVLLIYLILDWDEVFQARGDWNHFKNFKIRKWNAIQKEKNWMLAPGNDKHWKKGMCLLHSASMVLPRRSAMPPLRLSIAWLVGRVRLDIIWFGPDPSSMEQKGLVKKLRVRWGGSV